MCILVFKGHRTKHASNWFDHRLILTCQKSAQTIDFIKTWTSPAEVVNDTLELNYEFAQLGKIQYLKYSGRK